MRRCKFCREASAIPGGLHHPLSEALKSMMRTLALLLCLFVTALLPACSTDSDSTTKKEIEVGSEAYLYQGSPTAFVAIDENSLSALGEALAAHDKAGFTELIQSGRVLPVPAHTKVLVLRTGLSVKVRILDGQYADKVMWADPGEITKGN